MISVSLRGKSIVGAKAASCAIAEDAKPTTAMAAAAASVVKVFIIFLPFRHPPLRAPMQKQATITHTFVNTIRDTYLHL